MAIFYDHPALRDYWYAVASDVEVTAGPVSRTLLGEPMVIYKDPNGDAVAAPDRCPHRQAPLSKGSVEHGVLVCCYHGWSFGEGGRCLSIPSAAPGIPIPQNSHLQCFKTAICYGLIWVCLGKPAADIPQIPEEDDAVFRRINNPVAIWRVSATRMTDNFLDIAHFPWVHTGTFGNRQRTLVEKIKMCDLDEDFHGYEYAVVAENPPAATLTSGQDTSDANRHMTTGFNLPFTVRSTIAYGTGLRHILLLLTTPIDDVNSYFTFVVWRNDDFSVSAEDMAQFDRRIGEEDRVMLEKIPGVLPFSQGALANTQSDKASTAWRLRLTKLLGFDQT